MNDTNLTSLEYNTPGYVPGRRYRQGTHSDGLQADPIGTPDRVDSVRYITAWAKSGVALGIVADIKTRASLNVQTSLMPCSRTHV